ncbi:MAG: PA0069 family radical SAM protein [Magnetovibrio sp.]|nr:PA0069 family radical SAM protein [Magnetovibrio sp.]
MVDELPNQVKKGRGAVSNAAGRFEPHARVAVDDGWQLSGDQDGVRKLRTEVTVERVKSALTRNTSPDIAFDRSLNPYRGCEHGCVYCYARPTHAYMNLSPGIDFESKLFAKTNMAKVLEAQLRKPNYEPATVLIGANTDPYQPIERDYRITRELLEVLQAYRHPTVIITKNHMVTRDLDVLVDMARDNLIAVGFSLSTLDGDLARTMEPRASTPKRRLQAMKTLSDVGVPVTVLAAPMVPTLNDHELEAILQAARDHGATVATYILLRLPLEVKDLFAQWLQAHAPNKAKRVLSLLSQSREGQLYTAQFGKRMTGTGVHAQLLSQRFKLACKNLGLRPADPAEFPLNSEAFLRPPRVGDQLGLLI